MSPSATPAHELFDRHHTVDADAVRVRQQHTGMPGIQPLLIIGVVELDSVT